MNDRLRTEATAILVDAALDAGVARFVFPSNDDERISNRRLKQTSCWRPQHAKNTASSVAQAGGR
jgi:hypothetical protein